jgi:fatty-acyl-CoA synthase
MNGLMMDYPLTLSTIFRRAEQVFPNQEIVWRLADKSISRYTFADFTGRAVPAIDVRDLRVDYGDFVAAWRPNVHAGSKMSKQLARGSKH